MKYMFSQAENLNEDARLLVESLSTLTKMNLNKQHNQTSIINKYTVVEEDYPMLNKTTKEKLLTYSAKASNVESTCDVLTKEGLTRAFTNKDFEWHFFSIQTIVLKEVLAITETNDIMRFVDVKPVGLGDSATWFAKGKALYDVEETSYGNNVTRPRKQYFQPLTLAPTPKHASVQFDVVQMLTSNYDFGAEMAKIVLSVRAKQLQDCIDEIFKVANVSSTVFYKSTFNKANYTELADRLEAVVGAGVTAYGSRRAFADMSDTVTTGFTVQDEIIKKSYIADLFGVPSQIFPQSVDTSTSSFTFRVPADRVVLLPNAGDKPVKMAQEDYVNVVLTNGDDNSISNRVYEYTFSYAVKLITDTPYGIQEV